MEENMLSAAVYILMQCHKEHEKSGKIKVPKEWKNSVMSIKQVEIYK